MVIYIHDYDDLYVVMVIGKLIYGRDDGNDYLYTVIMLTRMYCGDDEDFYIY